MSMTQGSPVLLFKATKRVSICVIFCDLKVLVQFVGL